MQGANACGFLEKYPDVLRVEDLCEITGECPATIRKAAQDGQLRGMKIGRRWFFSKAYIAETLGVANAAQ